MHTSELIIKVLQEGSCENPAGKEIHPHMTVPEMQEQTALHNRRRAEAAEIK